MFQLASPLKISADSLSTDIQVFTANLYCEMTEMLSEILPYLLLELHIGAQYVKGIDRNKPIASSVETSPVKQFLHLITFCMQILGKKDFLWFFLQSVTVVVFFIKCDVIDYCSSYKPYSLWCGEVECRW